MEFAFIRYLIETQAVWAEFRTDKFNDLFKFSNTSDARKFAIYEWVSNLYDLEYPTFAVLFVQEGDLEVGVREFSKFWSSKRITVEIHNMVCEIMFVSSRVVLINMLKGFKNEFLYTMFQLSTHGCNCIMHWSITGRSFEKSIYFQSSVTGNTPYLCAYEALSKLEFKRMAKQEAYRNENMRNKFMQRYYKQNGIDGEALIRFIALNLFDK